MTEAQIRGAASLIQEQLSDMWGPALLRNRQLLLVAETSGWPSEDLSRSPLPANGRAGGIIVIFRGKVWRELDLTLKKRVLETACRAAGECSPTGATHQTGNDIWQRQERNLGSVREPWEKYCISFAVIEFLSWIKSDSVILSIWGRRATANTNHLSFKPHHDAVKQCECNNKNQSVKLLVNETVENPKSLQMAEI